MGSEKEAVQRVAQRIIDHQAKSGKPIPRRDAERKAVKVAERADAKRKR